MNHKPLLHPAARAALWMIGGGACYVAAAAIARHLSSRYGAFELAFFRAIVAILFVAPMFWRSGIRALATRQLPLHSLRTVFTYGGLVFWFLSVGLIPISDYTALLFTQPLFTIAGAVLFLGERASWRTWAATATGLCGALIILRPGFAEISLGMIFAVCAGLSYAGVNNCVRVLARRDRSLVIVAWVNMLMLPLSFVPAVLQWVPPVMSDLPLIIGIGVFSTMGQYSLTRAVGMADARIVQPFDFFRLPVAAIFGFIVFGEVSGLWTWVGAAIIFAAGYYVLMTETRLVRH